MEPITKPQSTSNPLGLIRTVAAGMAGIRGRSSHEQDTSALKPLHIIITAVVFMVIFVSVIVTIATMVVAK